MYCGLSHKRAISHNLCKILPFPRILSHFLHLFTENLLWENINNFPFEHCDHSLPWLIKPTNFLPSLLWYTTSGPKLHQEERSLWNSWEQPSQYICHYSLLALSTQEQDDFILSEFWGSVFGLVWGWKHGLIISNDKFHPKLSFLSSLWPDLVFGSLEYVYHGSSIHLQNKLLIWSCHLPEKIF